VIRKRKILKKFLNGNQPISRIRCSVF